MSQQTNQTANPADNQSSLSNTSKNSNLITKYKKVLVNKRLAFKRKVIKDNRLKVKTTKGNLRRKLKSAVEGENPNNILGVPNEIWEMVFDNFDDTADIQNCYDTCQQFRSSCSSTQKTLLQIRKILPILLRSGYLTHNQILNLRLISKPINNLVDHFFQSKHLSWSNFSVSIKYNLIPHLYNSSRSEIEDELHNISKGHAIIQKEVLNHPKTRNPFISRYVKIHESGGGTTHHPDWEWQDQVFDFLNLWGKQIWYLDLGLKCTTTLFLEFLQALPNLKYLNISGTIGDYGSDYCKGSCSEVLSKVCSQLTCLILPDNIHYISEVHDDLISRFSEQLQEFHVNMWGEKHSNFKWANLRKLVVSHVSDLDDLLNCRAENLEELNLEFWARQKFDLFLKNVKNFPRLKILRVFFGANFEMSEDEVIKKLMEKNNVEKGFRSVKKLSFQIPMSGDISLDFLAWFPMLEELEIDKVFVEYGNELDGHFGLLKYENDKQKIKELVEIKGFLLKYKDINLEKSNVWKVLPFLKNIKIKNLSDGTAKHFYKPL